MRSADGLVCETAVMQYKKRSILEPLIVENKAIASIADSVFSDHNDLEPPAETIYGVLYRGVI